jgi:hypothetical protein
VWSITDITWERYGEGSHVHKGIIIEENQVFFCCRLILLYQPGIGLAGFNFPQGTLHRNTKRGVRLGVLLNLLLSLGARSQNGADSKTSWASSAINPLRIKYRKVYQLPAC